MIRACSDKTRANMFKSKYAGSGLDAWKKFLPIRVVKHRNGLSREAVNALFWEVFKSKWDRALSHLVQWKVLLPMAGGLY